MTLMKTVGYMSVAGLIALTFAGSSHEASATTGHSQTHTIAAVDSSEQVLPPSGEEQKAEIVEEFTETFADEVQALTDELVAEREKVGVSNNTLEEFEADLAGTEFGAGLTLFTSQIFQKDSFVENLELQYELQMERVVETIPEWEAELALEVEREAEREKERLRKEEESRIEAERVAAEQAAHQAATQNTWQAPAQHHAPSSNHSSAGNPPAAPSGPVVNYTVRVAGAGGQGLIDACVGAVWWSGAPNLLAEHWHCGGAGFPQWAGAVIHIPGMGLYQSAGVVRVVNQANSSTADIPGGYSVVYQTCLNNNPATTGLIGLTKIG